jgi:hypothetical protein
MTKLALQLMLDNPPSTTANNMHEGLAQPYPKDKNRGTEFSIQSYPTHADCDGVGGPRCTPLHDPYLARTPACIAVKLAIFSELATLDKACEAPQAFSTGFQMLDELSHVRRVWQPAHGILRHNIRSVPSTFERPSEGVLILRSVARYSAGLRQSHEVLVLVRIHSSIHSSIVSRHGHERFDARNSFAQDEQESHQIPMITPSLDELPHAFSLS